MVVRVQGARMRVATAAGSRTENTLTYRHTDTQKNSRTRARAPTAQAATEGPPPTSFSGVNAITPIWRERCALLKPEEFFKITFTQLQVSLSSYMEMALSNAATSHGTDLGFRWWVGCTGPRGGAASRASTVRNRRSCWAPQLLLALAGLLPTCGAGEESNGKNSPKCTVC